MKRLLILSLILILLLSLIGCASSMATTTGNYNASPKTTTVAAGKSDSAEAGSSVDSQSTIRKIVRNANLSMAVKDVLATYDELLAYAAVRGGYETSRSQRTVNDTTTIDAQIKIKPEELDGFLDFADTKGDVTNAQTSTDDITESYYDAQTRLQTMEKSLETYFTFLTKAKTIDESLSVQNQINQLTREIESLKGKLRLWDNLLAESTVSLHLSQQSDPIKTKKQINWSTLTFEDMGYLMQSGLTGLLNFIVNVLQWMAIALVVTVPVWIPALVIILIIHRRNKKRRAQWQQNLQTQVPTPPVTAEAPEQPEEQLSEK